MTNKETLQENNAELVQCLALAESLPDAGSPGGGSCSCYSVPIQKVEYNNDDPWSDITRTFTYTQVAENLLKAIIHVAEPQYINCGGYPYLRLSSDNPFGNEGVENVYVAKNYINDNSQSMSINVYQYPPLSISFSHPYYSTPPNDWFVEITAKTDTREIWVVCQEMGNPYY